MKRCLLVSTAPQRLFARLTLCCEAVQAKGISPIVRFDNTLDEIPQEFENSEPWAASGAKLMSSPSNPHLETPDETSYNLLEPGAPSRRGSTGPP